MKKLCIPTTFSLVLLFVVVGCRDHKPTDFSFRYSMESVNNYKMVLTFGSDKSYSIEEHNYFMDSHTNRYAPVVHKGTLTDVELEEFRTLLAGCRLFAMKDSYGFDDATNDALSNIIYQIDYVADGKEKMISIRSSSRIKLPQSYPYLLSRINLFLKKHH